MIRRRKYLGIMAALGMVAAACGGTGSTTRVSGDGIRADTAPTQSDTAAAEIEDDEEEDDCGCLGDTLTQYGGLTYLLDYRDVPGDFKAKYTPFVIACDGCEQTHDCRVDGESAMFSAEGKTLKVAIGVDTVRYDITSLPNRIEPIRILIPPDCRKHTVDHTFPIGRSDMECQFRFYSYLPEEYPDWLRQYVAATLYSEHENLLTDAPHKNNLIQYEALRENPKLYKALDTSEASIETIVRYFGRRFEKLYKKRFDPEELEHPWYGMLYEYQFEVTPAWISPDGSLATYRFYSFEFGGGVHGMMYEYYLTFDTETGRILGRRDFYGDSEFRKTMKALARDLGIRRFGDPEGRQTADIGDESELMPYKRKFYEEFQGKYYPRPALLGDRVVFSYQPYDKGCFAEGILHFALSYNTN